MDLQTDVFGWWISRPSRAGIGIHGDGQAYDFYCWLDGAGCGYFPVISSAYHQGKGIIIGDPFVKRSGWRCWVDALSGWPPKSRFDKYKPKTIEWMSVPEDYSVPANHPFAWVWAYGQKPGPRKLHQGTARYYA